MLSPIAEEPEELQEIVEKGERREEVQGEGEAKKNSEIYTSSKPTSNQQTKSALFPIPYEVRLASRPASKKMRYFHTLLSRGAVCAWRYPLLVRAKTAQIVVIGILIGTAFYDLGHDQSSVQNRLGCLLFILIAHIYAHALGRLMKKMNTHIVHPQT